MILKDKIDFLMVIVVEKCNPNADPLQENRPRQDIDELQVNAGKYRLMQVG